jgi:hypothetical protein
MRDGNWTAALYVDDQASAAQQAALGQIFSGQVGGPMERVALLFSRFLGVKTAPMTFRMEGNTRSLVIPDILEVAVAAVTGREGGEPVWATNATHPVSSKLALAQATAHRFNDHNLAWNISGTNGHFAPFHWQAP